MPKPRPAWALAAIPLPASWAPDAAVGVAVLAEDVDGIHADHVGPDGGEQVTGFLDEEGFNPESKTETYAALKLDINTCL